jgi:hypothetical protein
MGWLQLLGIGALGLAARLVSSGWRYLRKCGDIAIHKQKRRSLRSAVSR